VAVFENRQPVTDAKFITKCSLFILLPGVVRLPKPKPTNDLQPIGHSSSRHIAKSPCNLKNY